MGKKIMTHRQFVIKNNPCATLKYFVKPGRNHLNYYVIHDKGINGVPIGERSKTSLGAWKNAKKNIIK
jgi:hypothetical protein